MTQREIDEYIASIPYLSFQQRRMLKEESQDLELWGEEHITDMMPTADELALMQKNQVRSAFNKAIEKIAQMRRNPTDYSTFNPKYDFNERKPNVVADFKAPDRIMGSCPCPKDGELTRCCNLKTLDAVQQCGFACAYCSIQSFYSHNEIKVVSDLDSYLENLKLEEDAWHIGTGQSSDSLLLGDDYGTLSALARFARRNPKTIIELKTKSARTDWLSQDLPRNIVATWSVNAPTIVEKEEHLTATLEARIEAALKNTEKGRLVGFHIHPMVYFKGWEDEYAALVKLLCDRIDPSNVMMVGIGALTFTKQNLKALRESGRPTRVTQMELTPAAGKFSYPLETKREMFSFVYSQFPREWKDNAFFYLCMEDPLLWMPCLGREYPSNAAFEADMKANYLGKHATPLGFHEVSR